MKKLLALVLALITITSLIPVATADGGNLSEEWKGEVISQFVSLYKKADSSSGYSRRLKNGTEFYILEKLDSYVYAAVPQEKDPTKYDYGYIMTAYIVENPTHIVVRESAGVSAYASPYVTDKRVGTVGDYNRFTVIATTGNYYIVSFRNAVCFLRMDKDYWIEEDLQAMLNGPYTKYVTTTKANVYGYASTKHGSIDTLKKDTAVKVFYVQGDYACIGYETVVAFVKMKDLKLAN